MNWNALIAEAVDALPAAVRARVAGVQIVVAEAPSPSQRRQMQDCDACGLLGLYEGVPLPDRAEGDEPMLPDRITIFTRAHVEEFGTGAELADEVYTTVVHEIGHFLGLDDDELEELGL